MFTALTNIMHIPPGGWKYTQSETGAELHGGDYYHLVDKVRRHRHLNKLPTAFIEEEVQAQLCEKMDPKARAIYCRDNSVHVEPETPRAISFDDVKHFLLTVSHTRRFVSQKEANRRAEICASCPKNQPIAGCNSCRNLVGLVFQAIGNKQTAFDARLRGCEICGCELKAAMHIPLEAFPVRYRYPDWCWHNEA